MNKFYQVKREIYIKPICFWCERELFKTEVTIDHLVSAPLAKEMGISREHQKVICCRKCNLERSVISSYFSMKRRDFKFNRKAYTLELLKRFEDIINKKINSPWLKNVLIHEIDTIRRMLNE